AGLVEYLGMTEEQRRADYRTRVEKQVREHPEDGAARLVWVKLLIEDRDWKRAAEAAPETAEAAGLLLAARQYDLALAIFEKLAAPSRGPEDELAKFGA